MRTLLVKAHSWSVPRAFQSDRAKAVLLWLAVVVLALWALVAQAHPS